MSEKLIVAVSAASDSRRAVDWAVARASARHQSIELLSVVGGAVGMIGEAALIQAATSATEQLLAAEADRIAAAGVTVTTRVEVGDPVAQLAVASEDAALLVIGSDYRGPGKGPARGAHGIRITAASKCPVVVVPDFDLDDERSGVVVGVDGSPVSEDAIAFAAAEADRLGEPLTAVIVWTPISAPRNALMVSPHGYRDGMEQNAREALALSLGGLRSRYPDLEIEEAVAEGFPSLIINELAEGARLTVVGSRGHGVVRRFLLGSISHEVLQRLASVTAVVR
ncbi:nucleotide-binding universal stress UspA family protein [Microbacterium sp. W4I4]|uniref:universal stress protein n=1 Tax=Microbacterium sp. W4I4 TaxID=3042295 RepID=UPI002783F884|nr:universal stress protein [Microbacterium sp. W4I4]MDQ0614616.1 nucleotide-binding universal stress UspA family protein [Microbacterium sp. W4I4]